MSSRILLKFAFFLPGLALPILLGSAWAHAEREDHGRHGNRSATRLEFQRQPSSTAEIGKILKHQPRVKATDSRGRPVHVQFKDLALKAYQDSACTVPASGTVSGAPRSFGKKYYGFGQFHGVSYSKAGTIYLKASASGLYSGCSHQIIVSGNTPADPLPVALVLSGPASLTAGSCSQPFTLTSADQAGTPANALSDIVSSLSGLGSATFFSDAMCVNGATSVTIAAGSSSQSFYLKDARAETLSLVASAQFYASSPPFSFAVSAGSASQLAFSSQPSEVAVAGQAFSQQPQVQVLDSFGNLASAGSLSVQISAASDSACSVLGGGQLSATANPLSSTDGSLSFSGVKYTQSGQIFLQASSLGLTSACSSAVMVSAAGPDHMSLVSGDNQSGPVGSILPTAVSVRVVDVFGNAAEGVPVAFAIIQGGGSVSAAQALTDASGAASTQWSLGTTPGANVMSVSAPAGGWTGAPAAVTISAQAASAPVSILAMSGPASTVAGVCSAPFTLALKDRYGNSTKASADLFINLSGAGSGAFFSDAACGSPTGGLVVSAGSSSQVFYIKDQRAENLVIAAIAQSLPQATLPFTAQAGPADHLILAQGDGQTAAVGEAVLISPKVRVVDAFENPISGFGVSFSITAGGGSVSAPSVSSDTAGFASTSFVMGSIPGVNTLVAAPSMTALPGTPSSLLFSETAVSGLAKLLIQSGPPSAVAGDCSSPFSVVVKDRFGNLTQVGADLAVGLSGMGEGAFYSDSACTEVVTGVTLTVGSPASHFYTKDLHAESLILVASAPPFAPSILPFTVQAAPASVIGLSAQPSGSAVAGQAFGSQPEATLTDIFGNAVTDSALSVTLSAFSDSSCSVPASGSLLASANPVTASSGVVTFAGVSYTGVGIVYLGLSAQGLGSVCSSAVHVVAGPADHLLAAAGAGQTAWAGNAVAINPSVKAEDSFGNAVSGVLVQFAVTSGGGSLGDAQVTTDAAGLASTSFTLGATPGSNVMSASAASLPSISFTATGTPRPPVKLLLSGPLAMVAGECSSSYQIQALNDLDGNTVTSSDLTISLSGASHGSFYSDAGCASAISSVTIAQGTGAALVYFSDSLVESTDLVAQSAGLASGSVRISISAGAAAQLAVVIQPSSSATSGTALAVQPAFAARDTYGNAVTDFSGLVTLAAFADAACVTPASGTLTAATNPIAAVAGQAVFSGVSRGTPGTIYLRASSPALASACSAAVTIASSMELALGSTHTCALSGGGVKCWGGNNDGQLGNGSNVNSPVPVQVVGLSSGVLAIGAGGNHTCAILSSGVVCWGSNNSGELGSGSLLSSNVPVSVLGVGAGVQAVVGGDSHTCVLQNGGVKCWGWNAYGTLGNGSFNDNSFPTEVQGLVSGVQSISSGSVSTCAIMLDETAYCWGRNSFGQLGNGTNSDSSIPVRVQNFTDVKMITPGFEHTCALLGASVKCWGHNSSGQLGDGTFSDSLAPVSVVGGTAGISKIVSGGMNFNCLITSSGAAKCWGQNIRSQLGDNRVSGSQSNVPVQVVGLTSGMQVLRAGYIHACASDGTSIKCWGWGLQGQLGQNAFQTSAVPVSVVGY